MQLLIDRIRSQGQNLGNGILNVNSLINHQVDPALMLAIGGSLASRFAGLGVSKVLTVETSGIAPALMTALTLGVQVVYARKIKPVTMPSLVYEATAISRTKGDQVTLKVSPQFLGATDKVLIVDDFLASGSQITALMQVVEQADAEVVGIGTVIEKQFEGGRQRLEALGLRIESLAIITEMTDDHIIFAGETG